MNDWYKNPIILIVAGVGVFAAYIIMNKGSSATPAQTQDQTQSQQPQQTGVVGGSYQYLDGQGLQHITATDPYGNLVGYSNLPPDMMNPQIGQLSSYVGTMSGQYLVNPYGGTTPMYAQANVTRPNYNAPYTL